jgi:phosphatidylserine/phosphatidylglycerophosphate/cardiolipin synthase-like enzyme
MSLQSKSGLKLTSVIVAALFTLGFAPVPRTLALLAPQVLALPAPPVSQSPSSVERLDYERLFRLARNLLLRSHVREFLRTELSDLLFVRPLVLAPVAIPDINANPARAMSNANGDANVLNRLRALSEVQLISLLQEEPSLWPEIEAYVEATPENLARLAKDSPEFATVDALRSDLRRKLRALFRLPSSKERMQRFVDPAQPLLLESPDVGPGYTEARFYANHLRYENERFLPADDLEKVWVDFIQGAKSQVALNVFDFDLMSVADALIDARLRGVEARVGIDASVIKQRPEVKAVYEKLLAGGVKVTAVESVGLNHQKMAARDWGNRASAAVLFSSGNLTQSCIGATGDLGPNGSASPYSIPNANHVFTMRSWVLAQLLNHELTKTIDLKLKGTTGDRAYPLSGSYQIRGEGDSYLLISFSPGGGLADINEHIIARTIFQTSGPVRMAQFAFSSAKVEDALFDRARREIAANGNFDFRSVGDKPFALAFWSMFLKISGLTLPTVEKAMKQVGGEAATGEFEKAIELGTAEPLVPSSRLYQPMANDRWAGLLGDRIQSFHDSIRVAPAVYGTHMVNGVQVTSKIHHKMILTGPALITGSFNFSESALKNQEYIMVIVDPYFKAKAEAMFDGLWRQTTPALSVERQALKRNGLNSSAR